MRTFPLVALSLGSLLAVAGCGNSDSAGPVSPAPAPVSDASTPAPAPTPAPVAAATPDASTRIHPSDDDGGLATKHMVFDDEVAPKNHTEMLWGDYIDKKGKAAVGWHSHDPQSGNAR